MGEDGFEIYNLPKGTKIIKDRLEESNAEIIKIVKELLIVK